MRLEQLSPVGALWTVFALAKPLLDDQGRLQTDDAGQPLASCDFLDQLQALEGTAEEPDAGRILTLIDRMSQLPNGPRDLRIEISHEMFETSIDGKTVKFWRLRQGCLRVGFFYEAGRVIICTHCFVKRGNKVTQEEKAAAREAYASYQQYVIDTKE